MVAKKKRKRKKVPNDKLRKRRSIGKTAEKSVKKPVGRKKYFFGRISKYFLAGAGGLISFYLILGLAADPQLLKKDLEEKYGRVLGAVNVSVIVIGMPVKPVVTAVPGCSDSYPYIDLDWADDMGVDTFDVWRNGALLASGLTSSNYRDSNVDLATTYTYYVVATGPFGTEQSDEISATTESQCYIPPPPPPPEPPAPPPPPPPPANLLITRIDIIDLTNFRCTAKTNKKKPTFSGTTNLAEARIAVEIRSRRGKRQVISTFRANSNGYWSWRSKGKLKKGVKTVYLTAYDPVDATRFATASLRFNVVKKKPSKKFLKKCRVTSFLPARFGTARPLRLQPEFSLDVEEETKVVHQGEKISFSLSDPSRYRTASRPLQIGILDKKGELVYEESGNKKNEVGIGEKLPAGDYKLLARVVSEGRDISSEDGFQVKEKPIFILVSGREITYRQLLGHLGWAAFFTLGILGLFLLLLFFEYHLTKRALFQVTDAELKKRGMID